MINNILSCYARVRVYPLILHRTFLSYFRKKKMLIEQVIHIYGFHLDKQIRILINDFIIDRN